MSSKFDVPRDTVFHHMLYLSLLGLMRILVGNREEKGPTQGLGLGLGPGAFGL